MSFQKGKSGNPGGRSKGWKKFVLACRLESEANLQTLIEIRDDREQPAAMRIAAIREMNDRAWGKAPQSVDVNVSDQRRAAEMTSAELMRIAAEGIGGEKGTEH